MFIKNTIRLYNTLTREVEDFVPVEEGKVKLYACGPTVYDYTHIGHVRKYMFDDVLVRLLRYLNYQVTHVMNITDVGHLTSDADTGEDKMEKGAKREGKTAWEVAKFYEDYFFQIMQKVLINRPDIVCRATEHIKDQIELVQKLEAKGLTYKIDDGIYFDISKFPDYGKLANFDINKNNKVSRIDEIPGKKHPADFALWKFSYPGGRSFDSAQDDVSKKRHMEWDSPWGKGFPGWHIECSAMSMKYLGETIDIHTAGIDHISIHSPNEIAQSEAATGKQFVRCWMHHNFLLVNGQKMSKSLNNMIKMEDIIEKGFEPLALRYFFLQTHYRQEANFTWEALTAAQNAYRDLKNIFTTIRLQKKHGERQELSTEKLDKVNNFRKRFKDVIRMDLNTPQSLGVIWEIVKSNIPPADKYDLLMITDEILGLGLKDITTQVFKPQTIPDNITQLVKKREDLRRAQKWQEADEIRQQIEFSGYKIEDTSQGTKITVQ